MLRIPDGDRAESDVSRRPHAELEALDLAAANQSLDGRLHEFQLCAERD
jgi:hypothetical protein